MKLLAREVAAWAPHNSVRNTALIRECWEGIDCFLLGGAVFYSEEKPTMEATVSWHGV